MNQASFLDSRICQNMQLSRTKCAKVIENVWAPYFKETLQKNIGDGPYSIIIDESTDRSVVKYLGIVIRFYNQSNYTFETKFLKLEPLENSDSEGIVCAIKGVLKEYNLKIENMCGIGSDNASVMVGRHTGVFKKLKDINPKLILIPCVCHSLQLAVSWAMEETVPEDIEYLLNETYNWFAFSAKRQMQYKTLFNLINEGKDPLKMIQKSATRWLSVEKAVSRISAQYLELKTHFSLAKTKEKCCKAKILHEMYKDEVNYLYLIYLKPILENVQKVNKVFESNNADYLKVFNDLSCLILSLIKRVAAVPEEMLEVDMSIEKLLPNFYLGYECEEKLSDLKSQGLISLETETHFRKTCQNFILKLINELQARMPKNLKILKQINLFSVTKCLRVHKDSISHLFKEFDINPQTANKIEMQCNNLHLNSWTNVDNTTSFWSEVYNYTDASNENPYKELASFAISLLVLPISNAAVERTFSFMKLIKDQRRNRMKIKMLNSLLLIKNNLTETCCEKFKIPNCIIKKMGSFSTMSMNNDSDIESSNALEDILNDLNLNNTIYNSD